jgi:chlorophyll(ide) b reductase
MTRTEMLSSNGTARLQAPARAPALLRRPTRRRLTAQASGSKRNSDPSSDDTITSPSTKLPLKAFPFVRLSPAQLTRLDGAHRPLALVAASAWLLTTALEATVPEPLPTGIPAAVGAATGAAFVALHWGQMKAAWRSPQIPLRVVITGGSKGLGRALAWEFLRSGDRVVITSRRQDAAAAAAVQLAAEADVELENVVGIACDVGNAESVDSLAVAAADALGGGICVWVNNAGASGGFRPFMDHKYADMEQIVRTNLLGSLLGMRAAATIMAAQPRPGHVFNVEGAGSGGGSTPNYAAYGATKAAIGQLATTMAAEGGGDAMAVRFHTIQPGMVLTDLLLKGATLPSKKAFNVMCEHPETVAAWLVPRMRALAAAGARSGQRVRFLTPARISIKLFAAPFTRNRFFDAEGRAVYPGEAVRLAELKKKETERMMTPKGLAWAYSASLAVAYIVMAADAAAKALPPH